MLNRLISGNRGKIAVAVLGVIGFALVAPTAVAGDEEQLLLDRMDSELVMLRKLIKNLKAKMKHVDATAPAPRSGPQAPPAGSQPIAEQCCSSNIRHINDRIQDLTVIFEELGIHYADRSNRQALKILDLARADMGRVSRSTAIFNSAWDMPRADAAFAAMTNSYNRLAENTDALVDCCSDPEIKRKVSTDETQGAR